MARSASVGAIMYAHISWVGGALQITIPAHKGDQEGANTYPKNMYANPYIYMFCFIVGCICFQPVLYEELGPSELFFQRIDHLQKIVNK